MLLLPQLVLGQFSDHAHDHELDELLHHHEQQLEFVENNGQFGDRVRYRLDLPHGQAVATPEGMVISMFDPASVAQRQREGILIEQEVQRGLPMRDLTWRQRGHAWLMRPVGASPRMRVEGRHAHRGTSNFFLGDRQAMDVTSYQEVWYRDVYPGIDLRYYPAEDGSLEYDLLCNAGSDPNDIALAFDGIEGLRLNAEGELVLPTLLGEVSFPAPYVYQQVRGREVEVPSTYRIDEEGRLRFTLGDHDATIPLVIDPIALRWATWVNTASTGDNHGHCIWVDPNDGAIYVVARVVGTTDQITPGAFDVTANGNLEIIIGKYLEPATIGGSGTRVWQTYVGGNGDDNPYAMEQGPDGNLYITGQTTSTNFPLLGGPDFSGPSIDQQGQSGVDVFVLKINTAGTSIKASVIGGNGTDNNFDVRLAANNDVFVCGSTTSTNLATLNPGTGASNTNNGSNDVLVFRLGQDLSSLVWMENYGGSGSDVGSIMLHDLVSGDLFVGGNTSSNNFPLLNARQSSRGGSSAGFIQRRLGATGGALWSSYFSSSSGDDANLLCMAFNNDRTEIYFGGVTEGLNSANITTGVYDTGHNGSNDFYVAHMDIDQNFIAGTYIGGSGNEVNMMGLNTDQNDDVYVFGYTGSGNFPTSAAPDVPLQTSNNGGDDKVFLKLESDLASLEFSTYYGGSQDDYDPVGERGIKFSNCRIYTIVTSESNNIPLTQGALNTTKNSSSSIYEPGLVVWANPPDLLGNTITGNQTVCAGDVPTDITGSEPAYVLPTIVRNNAASSYPSLGSAATYQWQISTDSLTWNDIPGATAQDLPGALVGPLTQKTFIRRIIGGDACILAGAADQVVTVRIIGVTAQVTNVTCNGANNGSITAQSDGQPPFSYQWSSGQTTQTITGLTPGNYTVTVTDGSGCQASGTFQVNEPPLLTASVNVVDATCNTSNGSASTSVAGGTPPYIYQWSNGSSGSSISGVPGGAYSVTITDQLGCSITLPTNIGNTGLPGADAGPSIEITCLNGPAVQLSGSSPTNGVSFAWTASNGGNIVSGANTATPEVNAPGTYTLTVTNDQSGCTSSDQVVVTEDTDLPDASASVSGILTCAVTSVQVNGASTTAGVSFSWTGPGGFNSSDQNPVVATAGIYVLTVTGANGCTSTANALVDEDLDLPGASASGGTLTCDVTSVMLMGGGNGSYSWTGPGGFTSSDQNPVVATAGTYVLTVTGANGCTSQASADVLLDADAPGASATDGTLTCDVTSVMLMGSGNGSFSWTGPGGFTSSDQNPVVATAGTYTLTVTGANGCTSQASADVLLDVDVPGASATGGTLTCDVTSVMLMGTGNGSYSWTGPGGFNSSDQNPVVATAGIYVLTVTGANGCTSTANALVDEDLTLPGASATGGTLTCDVTSVMLMGGGNGSYSWTGPGGFTSSDQNPVVATAGTYTLTVTGANGCTSQASADVLLDADAPIATAIGGSIDCDLGTFQLIGTADQSNVSFSWTGPNGFLSTQQDPVVSDTGLYVLVVTATNGCTGSDSAQVSNDCSDCPPLIIDCGPDVTVECGTSLHPLDIGHPIFRKDPGCPEVFVNWTDQWFGTCPYTLVRTWTATDSLGLVETCVQTITVIDTQAPELLFVPGDITVNCDAVPEPTDNVIASDNCKEWIPVSFVETSIPGNCPGSYILERTWSATDDCGNTASQTQVITVQDILPPQLMGVPQDTTVQCQEMPPPAPIWAVDACDLNVSVQFNEQINPGQCAGSYTVVRTWAATDACGNTAVAVQLVLVIDTTPPNIVGVPGDVTVECNSVPPADHVLWATDNCKQPWTVVSQDSIVPGACEGAYTILRIWSTADDCGNATTATQMITVVDNTPPTIVGVPDDVTVSCDSVPPADQVLWAEDNCKQPWTVVSQDSIVPGNGACFYTILRTWATADDCGNTVSAMQVITVIDTELPALDDTVDGTLGTSDNEAQTTGISDLEAGDVQVQAFPNPFRENCTIVFTPTAAANALLQVLDVRGRIVGELLQSPVQAGVTYRVPFDAAGMSAGTYTYRLILDQQLLTGRIMLN